LKLALNEINVAKVNDERHDRVGEVGGERGFGRDRILRRNDRRVAVSWSSQVPIPVHTDLAHLRERRSSARRRRCLGWSGRARPRLRTRRAGRGGTLGGDGSCAHVPRFFVVVVVDGTLVVLVVEVVVIGFVVVVVTVGVPA